MRVLGIETSCDDTSAAVIEAGWWIRSLVTRGQHDVHAPFGGVVPELAGRCHTEKILLVIDQALREAGVTLGQVEGIAVTNRPGLIGSLLVGVTAAQALGMARGLPVVGVHHIEGHLFSPFLRSGPPPPDEPSPTLSCVTLVASGGHTDLYHVRGPHDYEVLGRRLDDAAGEALDKGARVLGLGNGGGAALDRLAAAGDPACVHFPAPRTANPLDFSFSGLKTALLQRRHRHPDEPPADVAAGYLHAIVEALVSRALLAVEQAGVERLCLAGGVAANSVLRARLASECAERGIQFLVPPLPLCTDNAAMIGAVGHSLLAAGENHLWELDAYARGKMEDERRKMEEER